MQAAKRIRYSNVTPPHAGWSSPRRREPTIKKNRALDPFDRNNAGWSSPVARQAHNLKVAGSNPAPATKTPIVPNGKSAQAANGFRDTAPAARMPRCHLCAGGAGLA